MGRKTFGLTIKRVDLLSNWFKSIYSGSFCKSSYQIYKPIEICNFVLWYHEGNNSANVYYDLAYLNKIVIKRIISKCISLSWKTGETQNMEILRIRPLENMQDIHLTWSWLILPTAERFPRPRLQVCNIITYTVCVSITSWKVFMTPWLVDNEQMTITMKTFFQRI